MNFTEIFAAFYTLYRGEEEVPDSSDPEYTIALRLANEAINRWAKYDGTYWKELFTTNLNADSDGDQTIESATATYDAPSDMQEAGGFIKLKDSNGNTTATYPIIEPQDAQFKGDQGRYAYFTGDPNNGYVLNLNPSPDANLAGKSIDYVYYKKPTVLVRGNDVTEMADPYFIVHRILAQRFRVSRNWSAYQTAFRDAEDALKIMKMDNDSGNWANPFKLPDNSGSSWGES